MDSQSNAESSARLLLMDAEMPRLEVRDSKGHGTQDPCHLKPGYESLSTHITDNLCD